MNKEKIFVIGDIHGCNRELSELIGRLPLVDNCKIVFLGDYIDRGGSSREVISTIIELSKKYNVITLMGNHEKMFVDFISNVNSPEAHAFMYNGGTATLACYSDEYGKYSFPKEHIIFFKTLLPFYETDDYFFVHAGVPDVKIDEIDVKLHQEDMLWIRDSFFKSNFQWGKTIIHGHTPTPDPEISDRRINLDTGCVFDGKLTALELPERIAYAVPKIRKNEKYRYFTAKDSKRQSIRFTMITPVEITNPPLNITFETVNFSDTGMLIYSKIKREPEILSANQIIHGNIGIQKERLAQFEGLVIRTEQRATGTFCAIKFTTPPKNLSKDFYF